MLAACPSTEPPVVPEAPVVPVRGGTLTLDVAEELPALDPHLATSPPGWAIARALHRGLYAYADSAGRQGTEPLPDLATTMPVVDESQRIGRISLLGKARYPGGAVVSVADAVASLVRLAKSDRGIGPEFKRMFKEAEAEEGKVLVIVSRVPFAQLLDLLAHPQAAIVPVKTANFGGARPLGAGPYDVASVGRLAITLERKTDLVPDPLRPSYVDGLEIKLGREASLTSLELDPGPPDLKAPGAPTSRGARVTSMCVRYLDLEKAGLSSSQHKQVSSALTRLDEIGTGPVASSAVPPVLQTEPSPVVRPSPRGTTPRFDLVVSTSPRDARESAALRKVLPNARVRTVAVGVLYGRGPLPSKGAFVRTWCADWPDALAIQRSPAGKGTSLPLWWPTEEVLIGDRIRGSVGSPMFPRGDPTALWLGP